MNFRYFHLVAIGAIFVGSPLSVLAHIHPAGGKFVQRDPIGDTAGPNQYSYEGLNPTRRLDHLGTQWTIDECPRRDCSNCWSTCTNSQQLLQDAHLGGGVICRSDGCLCACVNELAFPPTSDPGGAATRDCAIAHEECHVRQPTGVCPPSGPPLQSSPPTTIDRDECECYAVELQCLLAREQQCQGDDCSEIPDRIAYIIRVANDEHHCGLHR